jgi:hypothetical protein
VSREGDPARGGPRQLAFAPQVASGTWGCGAEPVVAFAADGCGTPTCSSAWSAPMPGVPGTPLVAGDVVYVGVGEDLHALGTGGAPLATLAGAGVPQSLAGGRLYTTTSAGGVTTSHSLAPTG